MENRKNSSIIYFIVILACIIVMKTPMSSWEIKPPQSLKTHPTTNSSFSIPIANCCSMPARYRKRDMSSSRLYIVDYASISESVGKGRVDLRARIVSGGDEGAGSVERSASDARYRKSRSSSLDTRHRVTSISSITRAAEFLFSPPPRSFPRKTRQRRAEFPARTEKFRQPSVVIARKTAVAASRCPRLPRVRPFFKIDASVARASRFIAGSAGQKW